MSEDDPGLFFGFLARDGTQSGHQPLQLVNRSDLAIRIKSHRAILGGQRLSTRATINRVVLHHCALFQESGTLSI